MKLQSPKQLSLNKGKTQINTESEEYLKFVTAPEKNTVGTKVVSEKKDFFPWEDPNVRDDITKLFNLRLSEKYYKKLEYLSKMRKESKHSICMDILLPELDKLLNITK